MTQDRASILFDLFLAFNRRLLSITRRLAPPLTLSESHLLGEIKQQTIINSSFLIKHLHIEKTKVSRTLASFIEREWIESENSISDKRVRYFTITQNGAKIFLQDNLLRNQQVQECLIPLAQRERRDLAYFLGHMADKFNASPIPHGANDPLCKIEIRRLTRVLGYLGENLLSSGMPVEECQVLHLAHRDGNCISMSSLKELLPYEMTMTLRLTTALERKGLLLKKPLPFDKRHIQILLTQAGIEQAQQNAIRGGSLLHASINNLTESEQHRFILLLERFLIDGVDPHFLEQTRKVTISKITSEDARQQARNFLIDAVVSQRRQSELKETLLHSENICYQISNFGEVLGVCEIEVLKSDGQLVYLVLHSANHESSLARELLLTCARDVFENKDITRIQLGPEEERSKDILLLYPEGKRTLTKRDLARSI